MRCLAAAGTQLVFTIVGLPVCLAAWLPAGIQRRGRCGRRAACGGTTANLTRSAAAAAAALGRGGTGRGRGGTGTGTGGTILTGGMMTGGTGGTMTGAAVAAATGAVVVEAAVAATVAAVDTEQACCVDCRFFPVPHGPQSIALCTHSKTMLPGLTQATAPDQFHRGQQQGTFWQHKTPSCCLALWCCPMPSTGV